MTMTAIVTKAVIIIIFQIFFKYFLDVHFFFPCVFPDLI
jgi:hypothetical protein